MKKIFYIVVFFWLLFKPGLYAGAVQQLTPIASNGETIIVAKSTKLNVHVKIITHEVQIGKPSDKRPDVSRSSCTYSRYPCSVVDGIDITANDKSVFVPRSVFCDLADLNTGEVKIRQKEAILMLIGGDASESYIVKIEFDAEQIKRRVTTSGMLPDQPLQETTYHRRILGD
jgi:hypothetical protein